MKITGKHTGYKALLLILVINCLGCKKEEKALPKEKIKENIELSMDNPNFDSSSLYFTDQQINQLKSKISTATGSLKTAYDYLIIRSDNGLEVVPNPYLGNISTELYDPLKGQAGVARNLALAYRLTGDEKYALKAIGIMVDWAKKCTNISYDDSGASMRIGRALFPMLCTYDLLKNSGLMDDNTKEVILTWFTGLVPELRKGVDIWHQNNYFNRQDFQNHLVSHTMGLLSLGLVLEDKSLIQFALDSPDNPRDLRELIAGSIFMKGDTPHQRESPNSPPPEDGEIYDRYRHETGKKLRGLQYTHLTLTLLTLSARICDNNGLDMFSYVAPGGENLLLSFEYYSDYYRLKDSCIKSNYYCGETDRIGVPGDNQPGMFELGYNYYPDSQPIHDLIFSGSYDRGTNYMDILGYTRLYSFSLK